MPKRQEDFDKAVQEAKDVIPDSIPGEEKLILYALFKQATVGDVNTDRPGIFDQKGRYKWDHWQQQKGKSKEQAMEEYIAKIEQLKEKYCS